MTPFMLNWLTRRAMSAPRVKDNIEIPTVYQRVEYLESTGNQWINTGFAPNQDNVRAIIDYECNARGDNIFFGMAQYDGNDFALNNYFINRIFYWWGGGNSDLTLDSEETRTLVEIGSVIKHNDEIVRSLSLSKTFVGNTNKITLFGLANDANPSDATYRATGKIYNFELYYGDELKMNLIPCYRKSDNKPGMWDMVTETFFVNSGSGADFIVGPNVN